MNKRRHGFLSSASSGGFPGASGFRKSLAWLVIASLLGSALQPALATAATANALSAGAPELAGMPVWRGAGAAANAVAGAGEDWERTSRLLKATVSTSHVRGGGSGAAGLAARDVNETRQLAEDLLKENGRLAQTIADTENQFARDEADLQRVGAHPELLARHRRAVAEFRQRQLRFQDLTLRLAVAHRSDNDASRRAALAEIGQATAGWENAKSFRPISREALARETVQPKPTAVQAEAASLRGAPAAALSATAPTPADLAPTIDAAFTPQIRALAASLGNHPVRIYHWVRDNIEFQPSHGSIQGAGLTLVNRRGNAFDTASLLIALLRSAGISARYAYGTVQVPIEAAKNWLGGVATGEQAADLLSQGGVQTAAVIVNGAVAAVRFDHLWVEAYVDYFPSRGAVHRTPTTWVPMDAAFKQYAITPPVNLAANVPFDAAAVAAQLNASATHGASGSLTGMDIGLWNNAFESYRLAAADYVGAARPGAKARDLMGSKTIVPAGASILAATLPYRLITAGGTYSALPAHLRHVLRLSYYASEPDYQSGNAGVTYEIPLPQVGLSTVGVDYAPATPADAEAFAQARRDNADALPAYLVNVIPQVQIEGRVVASAPAVRLGTTQYWRADITDPRGVFPPAVSANRITAGSHVAFVVNPGGVTPAMVQQRLDRLPANASYPIREGLQQAGLQFWMLRDQFDQFVASQHRGHVVRLPSVGAFSTPLQVTYAFGVPRSAFFNGYQTDIKRNLYAAVNDTPQEQVQMFTRIGTTGSLLEAGIWELLFGRQFATGATASKILAVANEQRIPVYMVDRSNLADVLPRLQLSADAKQEISNAVNAGNRVITPEREVDLGNWKGAGYVIQDPQTGTGIYQIDGGLSGGVLIGCVLKALLENCTFQKFLAKYLQQFLNTLVDRAMRSALLAPAAVAFPIVAGLSAQAMWWLSFHLAVVDFAVAIADGEMEQNLTEAVAALAACSIPSACGLPRGRGGPLAGNPVMVGTGQKIEIARDYAGAGAFPLSFTRTYMAFIPQTDGRMGRKWRHNYERSILIPPPTTGTDDQGAPIGGGYEISLETTAPAVAAPPAHPPAPDAVLAMRGDGSLYQFNIRAGAYRINGDTPEQLTRQTDGSGQTSGWTYTSADDETESYDAAGRLIRITNRAGDTQTLTYVDGKLAEVKDAAGRKLGFGYDADGRLATVTDPANGVYRYTYDAGRDLLTAVTYADLKTRQYLYENGGGSALLTGIVDENNTRYATFRYDYQSRVVEESHAGAADRLTFDYQGDLKTVVTDAMATARTYEFVKLFGSLRVKTVTEPCATCGGGSAAQTEYDANGYVASETDFNGNRTVYMNDARGQVLSRTDAAGTPVARTVSHEYDSRWRVPVKITEPTPAGNRVTEQTLDARGNVIERKITAVNAAGVAETRRWIFSYNAHGQVETTDGPRSDVADLTVNTYAGDQLETSTDAVGNVIRYEDYDAHGRARKITDANGLVTAMAYDARGRLQSSSVGGEATGYEYDNTGNLAKLTLPDGSHVRYGYDGAQRLTTVTDGQGNQVVYTLDAAGNRQAETTRDPQGTLTQTLTRAFDGLARVKELRGANPATERTQYGYDAQGNLKSTTDPLGQVTVNDYDPLNRLVKVTEPQVAGQTAAGIIQYGYDAQDNLARVTDPRGLITTYGYSGFNELQRLQSPDTGDTAYRYDAAGNVKTVQDARGQVASYGHDALNRLKTLTYADETLTFTYGEEGGAPASSLNAKGRLAQMSDGSGTTQYAYDRPGRVTEKRQTVTLPSGSATLTTRYGYNAAGQLATLTTPSNQIVDYGYANNQVVTIRINGQALLTNASYFPFGDVQGWTWGNGRSYLRGYDQDGRIARVTLGAQVRRYGFDDASRIIGIEDQTGTTTTAQVTVGYDALDRLTSATRTGTYAYGQRFGYDRIGNRTEQTIDGQAATLSYASSSNRLTHRASGATSVTYRHDAVGNLIDDGTYTYGYSGRNRLTEVQLGSATTARYRHNGVGERVAKTVNGVTTLFSYDEDGRLLGEYDGNGALIQETVWLDDMPVATLRPTMAGQPISAGNPLRVYYVWADHLDTPRVITTGDAANDTVWTWDSDPFGGTAAQGTLSYHLRFPGQYFDAETQTHYNYFRDYDPATGRYRQSDPIGLAGGLSTYAYVLAEPISTIDPYGLWPRTVLERNKVRGDRYRDQVRRKVEQTCEDCTVLTDYRVETDYGVRVVDIAVFSGGRRPTKKNPLPDKSYEVKCGKYAKRSTLQRKKDEWLGTQGVQTRTISRR